MNSNILTATIFTNDLVTPVTAGKDTAHAIAPTVTAPGLNTQPLPATAGQLTLSARTGTAHSGTEVRPEFVIPLYGDDDDTTTDRKDS